LEEPAMKSIAVFAVAVWVISCEVSSGEHN